MRVSTQCAMIQQRKKIRRSVYPRCVDGGRSRSRHGHRDGRVQNAAGIPGAAGNCSSGSVNFSSGHCSRGGTLSRTKVSMWALISVALEHRLLFGEGDVWRSKSLGLHADRLRLRFASSA